MKSKPFLGVMAGFAFLALSSTAAIQAADQGDTDQQQALTGTPRPEAPKEPVPIQGSKRTVMFPHDKGHENIDCVTCHHKVDGKETFAKCADAGCHDDLTAKKGENSLYFVMHNKGAELKHQTCMSCHVKVVEDKPDLKRPLTGCSQSKCHPGSKKKAEGEESQS